MLNDSWIRPRASQTDPGLCLFRGPRVLRHRARRASREVPPRRPKAAPERCSYAGPRSCPLRLGEGRAQARNSGQHLAAPSQDAEARCRAQTFSPPAVGSRGGGRALRQLLLHAGSLRFECARWKQTRRTRDVHRRSECSAKQARAGSHWAGVAGPDCRCRHPRPVPCRLRPGAPADSRHPPLSEHPARGLLTHPSWREVRPERLPTTRTLFIRNRELGLPP